jgi:phenylalanyl-tRNA synthetase beta chain
VRVPLSWLREFVDVSEEPERLAADLTLAGLEAGGLERDGDETILDLDVTTNRVDCMNVHGVAREVSVLYGRPLRPLELAFTPKGEPVDGAIALEIAAPDLCPRFTVRVLDVKVGPSPARIARRLEQCGVRPINNVVDLTNYVMLEMGQPSHAFDAARLAGSPQASGTGPSEARPRLIVRWAQPGETLITLDGVTRELADRVGVVADGRAAQGLAGIMGGAASEVSDATRVVVLEAAYWNPLVIRRAARALGIHTEASHRFERGADPEAGDVCSARIAHLLESSGAGTARPGLVDVRPVPREPRPVLFRPARAEKLIGDAVGTRRSEEILAGLGFQKRADTQEGSRWEIPSWRGDVTREVDVVEEVARHHGLGRVPSTLPPSRALVGLRPRQERDRRLRRFLAGAGLTEAITYSFVGRGDPAPGVVRLANPLSEEHAELRTTLVRPGLLDALRGNLRQGRRAVRLFEVGRVFPAAEPGVPREGLRLGVLLAGVAPPEHWSARARACDFFDASGLLQALLERLGLEAATLDPDAARPDWLHPGRSAGVSWRGESLGWLGAVHPAQAAEWELRDETLVMELELERLLEARAAPLRAAPLPRHPAVERDLSLLCDAARPAGGLLAAVREAGGASLRSVIVRDRYDRLPIPRGRVSLTLGLTFQEPERTLTGDEVQAAVERVVEALRATGAEIRGE